MLNLPTVTVWAEPTGGYRVRMPKVVYEERVVPELGRALAIADALTGGNKAQQVINVQPVNAGGPK